MSHLSVACNWLGLRGLMERLAYFIGPNGNVVTMADLPSPMTTRWVIRRKAEVVLAVRGGMLGLEEACARYHLTVQEFHSWHRAIEKRGLLAGATKREIGPLG